MNSKQINLRRKYRKNRERLKNLEKLKYSNKWLNKNWRTVTEFAKASTMKLIGKESL